MLPQPFPDTGCAAALEKLNKPGLLEKIEELEGKLDEENEAGYQFHESPDGELEYNFVQGTRSNTSILYGPDTYGGNHTHWNLREDPNAAPIPHSTDPNLVLTPTIDTIKMFSPGDVSWLYNLANTKYDPMRSQLENELEAQRCFVTVATSSGNYLPQIENVQEMLIGFPDNFNSREEDMVNRYIDALENDTELGLINFLEKEFQIFNVGLYKFDKNGNTTKITKDQNGTKNEESC